MQARIRPAKKRSVLTVVLLFTAVMTVIEGTGADVTTTQPDPVEKVLRETTDVDL